LIYRQDPDPDNKGTVSREGSGLLLYIFRKLVNCSLNKIFITISKFSPFHRLIRICRRPMECNFCNKANIDEKLQSQQKPAAKLWKRFAVKGGRGNKV